MSDLMNRDEVAAHLGIAPEAVRSTMRRYGITEQRGYPRDKVLGLQRKQPARRKDTPMATTTSYGTWYDHTGGAHVRVEDDVTAYLGEFADDYDVDGLVAAYRAAINEALPEGVSLNGDEFYGPYPRPYPRESDLDLAGAIASVDLGALAEQHDLTTKENQP